METSIDTVINNIPYLMKELREDGIGKYLLLKDDTEFLLGYVIGYVRASWLGSYFFAFGRTPDDEMLAEATIIILKRGDEIKEKIFQTG